MTTATRGWADAEVVELANTAKNLARINSGARISWISDKGGRKVELSDDRLHAAVDLLRDDNTLSCHLVSGNHAFLIALPNISNVQRLAFINENTEMDATVQVFVSDYRLQLDDSRWVSVSRNIDIGRVRFVSLSLPAVEAKYVKVSFSVRKAGTLAGLGLYGQKTLQSFADQHSRSQPIPASLAYTSLNSASENNLDFNYANLYASARVIWVSSGSRQLVRRMIDDDTTTGFDFAADDPRPTAVIELAAGERIRRVSAVYDMQPGKLDIFLANQMPDRSALDSMQPVVSVTDKAGAGKAAAEFDPQGARYVILRWTPAKLKGAGKFNIVEVGAFSDVPVGLFNMSEIPEQLAQSIMVTNPPVQPPAVLPVSP